MKKYQWKNYGISCVKAQVVGEEIECLIENNHGQIQPVHIVNAARPKKSPLHSCFEWNDMVAAEKYREDQARYLLRHIVVVQDAEESECVEVRAFVSVPGDQEGLVYTSVQRAFSNPTKTDYVLRTAYDDLQAWREKYRTLSQFKKVFKAIDETKIS